MQNIRDQIGTNYSYETKLRQSTKLRDQVIEKTYFKSQSFASYQYKIALFKTLLFKQLHF